MPLQGRKPFVREKPPNDLRLNEELFYCRITHEVFREYEKFFDRVILCNSLVWTCAVTGRGGLTYQEAVDCENNARQTLQKFPDTLKQPILFLASLTSKTRLNDMCDDVFNYVKDRYFVGETVEVSLNGIKKTCDVKKVISPDKEKDVKSSSKQEKPKKVKAISADRIKYEVKEKELGKTVVVKSQCISRPKGTFTKPQNKLFIKHHTCTENGIWKLKEEAAKQHGLNSFKFSDVFSGTLPKYALNTPKKKTPTTPSKAEKTAEKKSSDSSGKKSVQGKLNFKKESPPTKKKLGEKEQLEFEKHRQILEEEREKRREEMKKQMEEEKERLRQKRLKEKEQRKEEKRREAEYLSLMKKPRDDLECDDLKDFPKATPIDCCISPECFGDAVMVLEFLNSFDRTIKLKDAFPHGFTFDHLEKVLTETDIQGFFNDLVQHLLSSVFQLQDWEDERIYPSEASKNQFNSVINVVPATTEAAVKVASAAFAWPQLYHGTILRNMLLDSFSITEILRLHILASGSDRNRATVLGFNGISDDPGLVFKVEEAELVKKLGVANIFQLNCEERLKILSLLINQLLLCSNVRNTMEENILKVRPLRMELKQLRWAQTRHQRESKTKKKTDKNIKAVNGEVNGKPEAKSAAPTVTETANPTVTEEEKENIKDLTPEEKQALEEKKAKEEIRLKAEFKRKEQELLNQIQKMESTCQAAPLGRDRAYRRFWVFRSLPGLFIEDDEQHFGPCLSKPTPQVLPNAVVNRTETSMANIRKYLQHLDDPKNGNSDKENDILQDLAIIQSDITVPLKDRKLSNLNHRVDQRKAAEGDINNAISCLQCKEKAGDVPGSFPKFCPHTKSTSVFGLCTAQFETCPVHNVNAPRTRWSFYYREEDLELLLNSLNSRGFREKALKDAIASEKERFKDMFSKCQYYSLNRTLPQPEVRKSQRGQVSKKSDYSNMSPEDALELTFRDMILELEERVYTGALGVIKVLDRNAWTSAIEQRTYDQQCKTITLGQGDSVSDSANKAINPGNSIVKQLACALLQVSQGIEAKYLHPPLGENEKPTKDKSRLSANKANGDTEKDQNVPSKPQKSTLLRWQESLMNCTSIPQLFVHLGTLECSIAWSRSILKAHCRICRRRGDAENMLLCDGCNRGHHLYCLKPPLQKIPQGDWFCLSCKPPEKVSPEKKKVVDSESEESDDDSEDDDEEEDEDEEEEEDDSGSEARYKNDFGYEVCEHCGDTGTVICCDGCPKVYHPECVNLRRIPRGEWFCPKCAKKDAAVKKAQKSSPTGSYSTRAQRFYDRNVNKKKSSNSSSSRSSKASKRRRADSSDSDVPPPKRLNSDSDANTLRRQSRSSAGGNNMLDYKTCLDMVSELMHHPSSWPFLAPVSKKDAPDYHLVIKRPMDFGTIKSKLNNMKYIHNSEFVRDVFLVLQNCEIFNARKSLEYKAARDIHKEVKKLLKKYNLALYIPNTVENLLA